MSLYDAAVDAYEKSRDGEARTHLADVLEPYDVASLEIVDVEVDDRWVRWVFADGPVRVAVVKQDGRFVVSLVRDDDGWTNLGTVTSLPQLGGLILEHNIEPEPEPEPEPEFPVWSQPSAGGGFEIGEKAWWPTRDDDLYEVIQVGGDGKNVWSPGPEGYGWQVV